MATLVSKVRALTQSTTTESSNTEVIEFLIGGADYLLNSIPAPLVRFAERNSSNITTSTGHAVAHGRIVGVKRNGIECIEVPATESYAYNTYTNSTPLAKASVYFPVYYVQSGVTYIKPNPTTSNAGVISKAEINSTALTTTTVSWTISRIEGPAIKYAAGLDANALSAFFGHKATVEIADIITDVGTALTNFASALPTWSTVTLSAISTTMMADALTKAQYLIDNLGATDAESYLTDDDPEMVASAVGAAAQEVSRAMRELDKEQIKISEYDAETKYQVSRFRSELEKAQSYLTEARARIETYQAVKEYNVKSQLYQAMAERLYTESEREIGMIINNNIKVIGTKAQMAREAKE